MHAYTLPVINTLNVASCTTLIYLQKAPFTEDTHNKALANVHVDVVTNQWTAEQLGAYYRSVAAPLTPVPAEVMEYERRLPNTSFTHHGQHLKILNGILISTSCPDFRELQVASMITGYCYLVLLLLS